MAPGVKREPESVRFNAKESKKVDKLAKKHGLERATYIRRAALGEL